MLKKIQNLIKKSRSFSEEEKTKYLNILKFMDESDLQSLKAILEEEAEEVRGLEEAIVNEDADFNKKSIKSIEDIYKKEYSKGICDLENIDKDKADKLLNNLN